MENPPFVKKTLKPIKTRIFICHVWLPEGTQTLDKNWLGTAQHSLGGNAADSGLDKPEMDVVPAETLPGFLQRPAELEFQNTTWSPRIGCGKIGRMDHGSKRMKHQAWGDEHPSYKPRFCGENLGPKVNWPITCDLGSGELENC